MSTCYNIGEFIPDDILKEVRDKFHGINYDKYIGDRLFFENSGGSLRLKSVVEADKKYALLPDCSLREHETAKELCAVQEKGIEDVRLLLNANDGSILTTYTASMAMFSMVQAIVENTPGDNVVTTSIEHPSAFDSCKYYAEKTGKELRVAQGNPKTGGIDVDSILRLVDKNTSLLSVMHASNISGANLDIEEIVRAARVIKPDLYIIVDCVQYAPHGIIDLEKTPVDGINIAPYKFFGNRGVAFAYVSDRVSVLPHNKLAAKEPNDWELGSSTPADYAAFSEIINYVCWLGNFDNSENNLSRRDQLISGMSKIKYQEQALLNRVLNGSDSAIGLRGLEGVTAHFDTNDLSKRSLILALTFDSIDCKMATQLYKEKGIVVYERVATSAYSKRILESLGLNGVVRVSPLHCNSVEDIDTFLKATNDIINEVNQSDKRLSENKIS